jgi:phosphotransferase system  glucose/maltose/N-acetylglucosamine-specific IIC component
MSYQPPFDGNWTTQYEWLTQKDQPPPSIRKAVGFIYAGAAIQALSGILGIVAVRGRIQSLLTTASATPLTASQLNRAEALSVGILILAGIVGALLWLWMAIKNKAGRRWARNLSTVFFAVFTVALVVSLPEPVAVGYKILPVAGWLAGLLAIVLLWQAESSDFYATRYTRYTRYTR